MYNIPVNGSSHYCKDAAKRAKAELSKLKRGQNDWNYFVLTKNCENFAMYCATKEKDSAQITTLFSAAVSGLLQGFGFSVSGIALFGLLIIPFLTWFSIDNIAESQGIRRRKDRFLVIKLASCTLETVCRLCNT